MQKELSEGLLLDINGNLCEAGFATNLIKKYERFAIKAKQSHIKESDYYYIGNSDYGVSLLIAEYYTHNIVKIEFFDFKTKKIISKSKIRVHSKGILRMPSSSDEGNLSICSKDFDLSFLHENGRRHLVCHYENFDKKTPLRIDIYLEETNKDSIVVATPFSKEQHFYYNQKKLLLKSNGYVKIGESLFDLSNNSFGVLNWFRGACPYKNIWFWSIMNAISNGKRIAFNFGYALGDTNIASENMFFYDDIGYKLADVRFDIPMKKNGSFDYLKPWTFRSEYKDIDITFKPLINNKIKQYLSFKKHSKNQVFGTFSGSVFIGEKKVYFDDVPGFAERNVNIL